MKRLILIAIAALALCFASCKKAIPAPEHLFGFIPGADVSQINLDLTLTYTNAEEGIFTLLSTYVKADDDSDQTFTDEGQFAIERDTLILTVDSEIIYKFKKADSGYEFVGLDNSLPTDEFGNPFTLSTLE